MVVASLLSSTLVDHAEGFFFVYMSGLLFAGYRDGWTRRRPSDEALMERGVPATGEASGASAAKHVP
jgi:hypothetical protein